MTQALIALTYVAQVAGMLGIVAGLGYLVYLGREHSRH